MIGKKFKHDGLHWVVVGVTADAAICTNGYEHGAYRFTFDELREILEKQNGSPAK